LKLGHAQQLMRNQIGKMKQVVRLEVQRLSPEHTQLQILTAMLHHRILPQPLGLVIQLIHQFLMQATTHGQRLKVMN